MNGKTIWILGFVLLAGILGVVLYTQVFQTSLEDSKEHAGLTRDRLDVEKAEVVAAPAAPASFLNAPSFAYEGPRQVKLSVVSLPGKDPVGRVAFWGTQMDQWEVYVGETTNDGMAVVSLPNDGMWEFSCFAPGIGAGRIFNVDAALQAEPWVMELHPFAKNIQLRAVDARTEKDLPNARFTSRHNDPDVLFYREPLATLPPVLNGINGSLNFALEQANIAYVWVEVDGYQSAAVSVFEGGEHKVRLDKLQMQNLQVLEKGRPVDAMVSVTFHASQHRFGAFAHSTLRPPETYAVQTKENGIAAIPLPKNLGHGGFSLSIASASGATQNWAQLQWASIPVDAWSLEIADQP